MQNGKKNKNRRAVDAHPCGIPGALANRRNACLLGREHCRYDTARFGGDDFVYDAAHLHGARRGRSACNVWRTQMPGSQCGAGLHYGGFHGAAYVGTH